MSAPQEQQAATSSEQESVSLFDKLYSGWNHVYGPDKTAAELKEHYPDLNLPDLSHIDNAFLQVARAISKYEAAAVRYQDIAYPNAEALVDQLRTEFEESKAKQDAAKFPIVSAVLDDIYSDTVMDVVYSGYLTMSNAIENAIRQIKMVLSIPEDKTNVNDPILSIYGIDFQALMNKERQMKDWPKITSARIFAINATANRIKHEFAIVRQDDVLIHYFKGLAPGNHIKVDKERFFIDLRYIRAYLYLLLDISRGIKFDQYLKELGVKHGTENSHVVPPYSQVVDNSYRLLLSLDDKLKNTPRLPVLTSLPAYRP